MTLTPADRRTLEAAASALRHMPAKARAGHLARKLVEMAARVEAGERVREERERGDVVDWDDVA